MQSISRFLSIIFHPIFIPLISVYLLFQLPLLISYKFSDYFKLYVYVALTVNLIIAPLLITIYLKKKGIVHSLEMKTIKERRLPYLVTLLFYLFTFGMLYYIQFPYSYLKVFAAGILAVFILFLLALLNQKLSAHLSGLGSICGMLFMLNLNFQINLSLYFTIAVLISGLVGSARLALNAHSFNEVVGGFALGFLCQYLILY